MNAIRRIKSAWSCAIDAFESTAPSTGLAETTLSRGNCVCPCSAGRRVSGRLERPQFAVPMTTAVGQVRSVKS